MSATPLATRERATLFGSLRTLFCEVRRLAFGTSSTDARPRTERLERDATLGLRPGRRGLALRCRAGRHEQDRSPRTRPRRGGEDRHAIVAVRRSGGGCRPPALARWFGRQGRQRPEAIERRGGPDSAGLWRAAMAVLGKDGEGIEGAVQKAAVHDHSIHGDDRDEPPVPPPRAGRGVKPRSSRSRLAGRPASSSSDLSWKLR